MRSRIKDPWISLMYWVGCGAAMRPRFSVPLVSWSRWVAMAGLYCDGQHPIHQGRNLAKETQT